MKLSMERERPDPCGDGIALLPVKQFEAALAASLKRFADRVQASLYGAKDAPVIVVMGGISANRFACVTETYAPGWWAGLAGVGKAIDPREFRILGIDFIADEEGKLAPSTFDQAEALKAALEACGAGRVHAIVGASYGGMTALAFAERWPELVDRLVIVSSGADPHPASSATRELQRRIVDLGLRAGLGEQGLSIARGLAMTTYRSRDEFERRFKGGIDSEDVLGSSEGGAYLRARGDAYPSVMSPGRFLSLSASIDRHLVDPRRIEVPALLIGSTSDQLVPPSQMGRLKERFAGAAELHLLPSDYGHDMFLKDADRLAKLVGPYLKA